MAQITATFRCPTCRRAFSRPEPEFTLSAQGVQDDVTWDFVRCPACGLLRIDPAPTDAELRAAYTTTYAPFSRKGISGWAKSALERRSVKRLWNIFGPPRRVLDVGCASGELLAAIRRAGNHYVIGVEPDPTAAQTARGHGIDVRAGFLDDARFEADQFDTVILSHAIEHLRDPFATMQEVNRVLTDGGALVLWLPNEDSIEARLLRQRWIGYDPPRHLTTFSIKTLRPLLELNGFRVNTVTHEFVGLEWAWALRFWLRERWPALERRIGRLHPLLVVLCTPLALIGALTGRSGRIRVIAYKI